MTFDCTLSFGVLISFCTLVLLCFSACLALKKWKVSLALNRAEHIKELIEKFRNDADIVEIFRLCDYGTSWYFSDFHNNKENEFINTTVEFKIDKTLTFFSYICYLIDREIIADEEVAFFDYAIERIISNKDMQNYLHNLFHFAKKNNRKISFQYLLNYAKENKFIDNDFYNRNAYLINDKYHRNLVF